MLFDTLMAEHSMTGIASKKETKQERERQRNFLYKRKKFFLNKHRKFVRFLYDFTLYKNLKWESILEIKENSMDFLVKKCLIEKTKVSFVVNREL